MTTVKKLCAACMQALTHDREVKRVGAASVKDVCDLCGKKHWCGKYQIALAAKGRPK